MNAVVIDGSPLWLAVPDRDRTRSPGLEDDLVDRVADQLGDAASRQGGGLAQCVEFLLAEVHLNFLHVGHFNVSIDTYQSAAVARGDARRGQDRSADDSSRRHPAGKSRVLHPALDASAGNRHRRRLVFTALKSMWPRLRRL